MPYKSEITAEEFRNFLKTGKLPEDNRNTGNGGAAWKEAEPVPDQPVESAKADVKSLEADLVRMNGTERRYSLRLSADPKVALWEFERVRLRLAHNTFYNPDFMVVRQDGAVEFHEVKGGHIRDDGMVKAKVAAEFYPYFKFRMFQWDRSGGWKELKIQVV